jgi:molybdenum cofactor synthesis domain-containing protein
VAEAARALVVTVSTRAAAGEHTDLSGPALADGLRALGLSVDGPEVVPDGDPVGACLRRAVARGYALVVTTGGTGLTPADLTPEQTAPLIDRWLPGIPEAVRAAGIAGGAPAAMLSRGVAGLARPADPPGLPAEPAGRGTLLVNLPGSAAAVREALTVLGPVLRHAVEQVAGGDHPWPAG